MQIIQSGKELEIYIASLKKSGKTIGLVPTMGALHPGHISLLKRAKMENDIVVTSIFVNRIQFNNPEDFRLYPRTPSKDLQILEEHKSDIVFTPGEEDLYENMESINPDLGILGQIMEARFRPGHFEGVAKIVYTLFRLVNPDKAYFGQKDLQQCKVIETLTTQYQFPVQIVICPVIRENDGLAMSSRNLRLSPEYRSLANRIITVLNYAGDMIQLGESIEYTKKKTTDFMAKFPAFQLEYFEIADAETLHPLSVVSSGQSIALCIAVYLENIRLIDNIIIIS